jgi:hypothetical protein
MKLDATCHGAEVLSFESRLMSQRTQAEGGSASDGLLTNHLCSDDKQELLGLIEDYRQGLLPLIVPLTLLKHHLSRYPVPEPVHQQDCLPEPREDERACSEDGAC